ncbi:hypothetical protein M3J09_001344 [Ascochyta lentis]
MAWIGWTFSFLSARPGASCRRCRPLCGPSRPSCGVCPCL